MKKIEQFEFSNEGTGNTDNERNLTKRLPREGELSSL